MFALFIQEPSGSRYTRLSPGPGPLRAELRGERASRLPRPPGLNPRRAALLPQGSAGAGPARAGLRGTHGRSSRLAAPRGRSGTPRYTHGEAVAAEPRWKAGASGKRGHPRRARAAAPAALHLPLLGQLVAASARKRPRRAERPWTLCSGHSRSRGGSSPVGALPAPSQFSPPKFGSRCRQRGTCPHRAPTRRRRRAHRAKLRGAPSLRPAASQ